METKEFQERFREWLGPNPENGAQVVAERSGYSHVYVCWVAGLIGRKPWPGSRRFIRKMRRLGYGKRWRDCSAREIRLAFLTRETLYDPITRL